MSRARHKAGGGVEEPKIMPKPYNAQGSEVEREAEEKAHGGKVHKRKFKDGGQIMGAPGGKRFDRPGRKSGGRIGASKSPLTTAAKITPASGHSETMDGDASDED